MRRKWLAVVLFVSCVFCTQHAVAASTTISIGGAENQVGGVWDTSAITISFNNFTETVSYGQYSTANSVASAFAAMFTRDYKCDNLTAQASGSTITFDLKGGTFGPITVDDPNTSFTVGTTNWQGGGGPPAPPAPPSFSGCKIGMLDLQEPLPALLQFTFRFQVGSVGEVGQVADLLWEKARMRPVAPKPIGGQLPIDLELGGLL